MGCDYIGYLAHTVMNNIPCAVCRGKGKTKFQPGKSEAPGERVCQSCWGEKLERIDPKASQAAATTLLEYCETKLKAVEMTGTLTLETSQMFERLARGRERLEVK